jgi:branched-chain amino acid transport system substrate-binding protein
MFNNGGTKVPLIKSCLSTFAILATMIASPAPLFAQGKDPIKVGAIIALTGPAAPFGLSQRDTLEVLVQRINQSGALGERTVQLSIYDEASNPTEAARGATKLIQQDNVIAIVGGTIGGDTLAIAPIAARAQVPVLAPNQTASVTSKEHAFAPWVFRATVNDAEVLRTLVDYLAKSGAKKVGIFHQEDAYGQDGSELISKYAPDFGLTVVGTASAPSTATDVAPQATKLKNLNPDAIVVVCSSPIMCGTFARATRQVGMKASLWGGVGVGLNAFMDNAGVAAEGVHAVLLTNWSDPSPATAELAKVLMDAGKTPRTQGEGVIANSLLLLVEALKKNPDVKGEALRAQIEGICGVKTYSDGPACFSSDNHDGYRGDSLLKVVVENGKFKTVK